MTRSIRWVEPNQRAFEKYETDAELYKFDESWHFRTKLVEIGLKMMKMMKNDTNMLQSQNTIFGLSQNAPRDLTK